jgi:hypothetical protein
MCGDDFCPDVLFTFNVKMKNNSHADKYHKKWMETQYFDFDQKFSMIEPNKDRVDEKVADDWLKTKITDADKINQIKNVKAGSFITFKAEESTYPLYTGVGNDEAHHTCDVLSLDGGMGTSWTSTTGTDESVLCERQVSLRVTQNNKTAKATVLKFAQTLSELWILDGEGEVPTFRSPVCKQGNQMFLYAGLRGAVTLAGDSAFDKTERPEKERATANSGAAKFSDVRHFEITEKDATTKEDRTMYGLWKECRLKQMASDCEKKDFVSKISSTKEYICECPKPETSRRRTEASTTRQRNLRNKPPKDEEKNLFDFSDLFSKPALMLRDRTLSLSKDKNPKRKLINRRQRRLASGYTELQSGTCDNPITTKAECQKAMYECTNCPTVYPTTCEKEFTYKSKSHTACTDDTGASGSTYFWCSTVKKHPGGNSDYEECLVLNNDDSKKEYPPGCYARPSGSYKGGCKSLLFFSVQNITCFVQNITCLFH